MAKELKESKEILLAVAYVGVKAIQAYKQAKADGKVDLSDAGIAFGFLMDPVLKEKVESAIEGADKIGADFDGANIFDVVKALVEVEPQVMELVKEMESLKA
jgi:hypothetical protein